MSDVGRESLPRSKAWSWTIKPPTKSSAHRRRKPRRAGRAFAQSLFASGVDGLMLTMISSVIARTIEVAERVESRSGGAGVRVFGQV